ncbi:calpain-2 catalytic subunit [Elysia marginata]|uniref:Calpain-2 catalytic subunit n=1 Tax=Elysia marginata TaxID=1093978 RepID=A0AAV4J1X5_9GAST|nr:calpain-2 catalytic subunit [Elysia marginata]
MIFIVQNRKVLTRRKQLEDKKLFIDAQFPPRGVSLGSKQEKYAQRKIVWKRPHEMSLRPVLIADGTSRHDMKQGDLNDCWFLSTLSLVAEKPQLISKIIQKDPNFGSTEYTGIFHCRFWQFGSWTEVFVDDLLPTVDGNLLFARSSDPNEFWVSLVEKAYANTFDVHQDRQIAEGKKKSTKGMVPNHSYVVTGAAEVPYVDVAVKLIRMRNPWGDTEWQGEWCDGGDEWKRVPETIKRELEVTSKDDGEFWMSYSDFRREYSNMIICNMSPDFDHDGISDKAGEATPKPDGEPHVERRYNGRQPLVVALLQVYKRGVSRPGEAEDLYAVGFEIFQLSRSASTAVMEPLDNQFFQTTDPLMPENQETYAKYRETSGRFFLYPGRYLLVPSTHEPDQSRDYVLRLFSVGKIECG